MASTDNSMGGALRAWWQATRRDRGTPADEPSGVSGAAGVWVAAVQALSLLLGAGLLGAAVIVWVAANWAGMPTVARLGVVQGGLVLLLILASLLWRHAGARVALLGLGGLILGALLALLGQSYQTGADPWQLFALWAVLLLPWCWSTLPGRDAAQAAEDRPEPSARHVVLWGLLALVGNVGLWLWLYTALMPSEGFAQAVIWLANGAAVALWEWRGPARSRTGADPLSWALLAWPVATGSVALMQAILSSDNTGLPWLVWVLGVVAILSFALRWRRDAALLAWQGAWGLAVMTVALMTASLDGADLLDFTLVAIVIAAMILGLAIAGVRALMRLLESWRDERRLTGEKVAATTPWYVMAMQAVGAWIAALLVLAALAVVLLDVMANGQMTALVLGGVLVAAGVAMLVDGSESLVRSQFGTVLSVAGQGLMSLFWLEHEPWGWLGAVVVAVIAYRLGSNVLHRLLCTAWLLFGIVALGVGVTDQFAWLPWLISAVALAAVAMWRSGPSGPIPLLAPAAWMLVLGSSVGALIMLTALPNSGWLVMHFQTLPSLKLVTALLPLALWLWLRAGQGMSWPQQAAVLLAMYCLGWQAQVLAFALSWLVLGWHYRQPPLVLLGLVLLPTGLVFYYHSLITPLLQKAGWLALSGAIALALGVWLTRRANAVLLTAPTLPGRQPRRWGVWVGTLVALVLVDGSAWRNERILAEGTPLVLALAPVDPRSLMQGDYMVLEYALVQQISHAQQQPGAPRDEGLVVVAPDARGELQWQRWGDAQTVLQPGEHLLAWRERGSRIWIAPSDWFFPEGDGPRLEATRRVVLRQLEPGGQVLLAAMQDEAGNMLACAGWRCGLRAEPRPPADAPPLPPTWAWPSPWSAGPPGWEESGEGRLPEDNAEDVMPSGDSGAPAPERAGNPADAPSAVSPWAAGPPGWEESGDRLPELSPGEATPQEAGGTPGADAAGSPGALSASEAAEAAQAAAAAAAGAAPADNAGALPNN